MGTRVFFEGSVECSTRFHELGWGLRRVVAWRNQGGTDAKKRSKSSDTYQRRVVNPDALPFCETDGLLGSSRTVESSWLSMNSDGHRAEW